MTQTAAIDIGATWIRGGLISEDATITHRLRVPTPKAGSSGTVVTETVITILEKLVPLTPTDGGIGIASAGPLDLATGSIVSSPNMVFDKIDIIDPLREQFLRPVFLINDCRAGALAEQMFGAGAHSRAGGGLKAETHVESSISDLVYITISTGIGGGVISGGRLLTGATGNAGEVGHLFVDSRYNLICGCGGTGHFEAYASGSSIPGFYARFLKEEGISGTIPETADAILSSRDLVAARFRDELAVICGRALTGVIVAYDPDVIVLDGPVARNHPSFVSAMIERVDRHLPVPRVVISSLGGDAPLLGAAVRVWMEDDVIAYEYG
ncbi:MAG: ROK family protein [Methanocalculus sp. MSAO_Arc2]|uniref:ROK family protein n=1 Tax=Methanocalculus sp. MSAO_Arc2 TaxID=2293855 RepID=UPI000FF5EA30|nr:MAG: ROK family protein [Methanocalculus sp. MSAO_Arc2]